MNIQEQHTAGAQSLGFDYQLYYFVLLALELKHGQKIGFEVKDNIHIDKEDETILFQAKHAIHENQNLTTLDVDLWKILRSFNEQKKQKIKLSLKQQDEWEEYFNEYKTGCSNIVNRITATDKKIDRLVYGLMEKEVSIIEKSVT